MTDLEIYIAVTEHNQLRFVDGRVACSELNCEECPLSKKYNGPMLCLDARIRPVTDKLPTLEFQYKATK